MAIAVIGGSYSPTMLDIDRDPGDLYGGGLCAWDWNAQTFFPGRISARDGEADGASGAVSSEEESMERV